jgi:hypothetical protein
MKYYFKKILYLIVSTSTLLSCKKNVTNIQKLNSAKSLDFSFKEYDLKTVDLSTVSYYVHIIMKVPKNAKVIKNGNGMIDILLNKNYVVTVNQVSFYENYGVKESIKSQKEFFIDESTISYKGNIIKEDSNGFIYTSQLKTAENGHRYDIEHHFSYSFTNGQTMYEVYDSEPLEKMTTDGNGRIYTKENANALYNWVKSSMKIKPTSTY